MAGYCLWYMVRADETKRKNMTNKAEKRKSKMMARVRQIRKEEGMKYASMTEVEVAGDYPYKNIPAELNEWNNDQKYRHSVIDYVHEDEASTGGDIESGNDKLSLPGNNTLKIEYQSSSDEGTSK